jgi:hypothetical protein
MRVVIARFKWSSFGVPTDGFTRSSLAVGGSELDESRYRPFQVELVRGGRPTASRGTRSRSAVVARFKWSSFAVGGGRFVWRSIAADGFELDESRSMRVAVARFKRSSIAVAASGSTAVRDYIVRVGVATELDRCDRTSCDVAIPRRETVIPTCYGLQMRSGEQEWPAWRQSPGCWSQAYEVPARCSSSNAGEVLHAESRARHDAWSSEYIFELRNDLVFELLGKVLERYRDDRFDNGAFRVVHFSIQDNTPAS